MVNLSLKTKESVAKKPIQLGGGAAGYATGASLRQSKRNIESAFKPKDYEDFDAMLQKETSLAVKWGREGKFQPKPLMSVGCEVESCLANEKGQPTPEAPQFMNYFSNDNGYYEMSKYNVEFEIDPVNLERTAFTNLAESMENNRLHTARCADLVDARVMLCGILPSLSVEHFTADMVTDRHHFRTLEKQLRLLNKNRPFVINIGHGDGLKFTADNLSIEGASTSLQIHLAIGEKQSAAFYNASQVASALVVAVAANSPFFMGKSLWAETRVPLFEQIMYERFVGQNADHLDHGRQCNDIFGRAYLDKSLLELFTANYTNMPAVLPTVRGTPSEEMLHLILHNRDILRWNRPVLGFSSKNPFLRIECRAASSGPTVKDMAANIAFYTGLVCHLKNAFLGEVSDKTKQSMPFEQVRSNFYRAAKDGLDADIMWLGKKRNIRSFLLEDGIMHAKRGLRSVGVDETDVQTWIGIIENRVKSQQTGTGWQRAYVAKHGGGEKVMEQMVNAYWLKQEAGEPVHTWEV